MLTHLDCTRCDKVYEPGRVYTVCSCGAPLYPRYDLARAAHEMRPGHLALREPTMWRYREVLPLGEADVKVSLGEGFTPLLPAPRLGARLGLPAADQGGGRQPDGLLQGPRARRRGLDGEGARRDRRRLPSAGNAGSALAAYAAAAGLKAHVFLPRDIAEALRDGDRGLRRRGRDGRRPHHRRRAVCAAQAKEHGWYECATLKEPYRVEGKKTMGYEIAEQLGWTLPDAILYPTGGGTGLVGMWKAFAEMETMGFVGAKRPRMYAVQAEGCAPIVKAFQEGREDAPLWEGATTHAHGLRVPKALGDFLILRGVRESRGAAIAVSEAEIVAGVKEAAAAEGLFMAPEGGACVAAARKLHANGYAHPRRHRGAVRHRHRLQVRREHGAAVGRAAVDSRQACAAR